MSERVGVRTLVLRLQPLREALAGLRQVGVDSDRGGHVDSCGWDNVLG